MSFISIHDPARRQQIVDDYVTKLHDFRVDAENDKAQGLQKQVQLRQQYSPIIQATHESTQKITDQLKSNSEQQPWKLQNTLPAVEYYLKRKANKDKYYGIQKHDGKYKMGEEPVLISDNNITIGDNTYQGTPGLWQLIMLNKPETYTTEDFAQYEEIVDNIQVIFNPQTQGSKDKPKTTSKYKYILSQMEAKYDPVEPDPGGDGIQFLPGDINGLLNRFRLLVAERQAGNIKSTTPEIVAILDELLARKEISGQQYNDLCKTLSC